jgi:hypothetical protein
VTVEPVVAMNAATIPEALRQPGHACLTQKDAQACIPTPAASRCDHAEMSMSRFTSEGITAVEDNPVFNSIRLKCHSAVTATAAINSKHQRLATSQSLSHYAAT